MSDRELMLLAAKAAGIKVDLVYTDQFPPSSLPHGYFVIINSSGGHSFWSPLADDGDALRLAVKLRINLHHGSQWIEAIFDQRKESVSVIVEYFKTEEHRVEATRRAIVRAAAEIGKAMP